MFFFFFFRKFYVEIFLLIYIAVYLQANLIPTRYNRHIFISLSIDFDYNESAANLYEQHVG